MLLCLPVATRAGEGILLILGDSLSAGYGMRVEQGWVALLAQRITAQGYPHRVVNASISGDTSHGGLARLGPLLAEARPQFTVVELGGNDGFWKFMDRVMEVTPANNGLDPAELPKIAEYAGVNVAQFNDCLSSGRMAGKV